jgi:hypothetical protein
MEKITVTIPVPKIIMSVVLWFVLRHRKKHYGFTFRRIKLIGSEHADPKHRYAIIDPEDYQELLQYPWQILETERNSRYAVWYCGKKIIYMHRQIMNAPAGVFIDHRYGNSLDNRKENLRIATIAQNQYNRRKLSKKTSSKYKGVHRKRNMKKYCAVIGCNGKRIFLGCFEDEIDAAKAYDEAAKKYHGEFAVLNFPQVAAKTDGEFAKLNFG